MVVVGLTGSLATGKSTVAGMFKSLGAKVIDADQIARRLLWRNSPCFNKIVRIFGKKILKNNQISRQQLAKEVFTNKASLRKLEQIIHPEVRKKIQKQIAEFSVRKKRGLTVVEVPLLFESGINRDVDAVVVVKSALNTQLKRASSRGLLAQEAKVRIHHQMPLSEKIARADFIIDNNGIKNKTKLQVRKLCQKLQLMEKNQVKTKK